jgi:hypothetical protein
MKLLSATPRKTSHKVISRGQRIHERGQCYGAVEILENAANLDVIIIIITMVTLL